MFTNILFYAFGALVVIAALGVITARNPVHCALFLVWAFFNSAVIWLLLEAEFLAIVLMLVYVGAVMVLFLFVVMMLDVNVAKMREGFTRYDIDLFKCIYCGFCEEACPVDAIVETRIHEYHMENRGENIMTKDKLLAIGERYEAMIAADKAADARYR